MGLPLCLDRDICNRISVVADDLFQIGTTDPHRGSVIVWMDSDAGAVF